MLPEVDAHDAEPAFRELWADFPALRYFSRFAQPSAAADYELYCIDVERDNVDLSDIAQRVDRTLRSKRFRAGYYRPQIDNRVIGWMSVSPLSSALCLRAGGHLDPLMSVINLTRGSTFDLPPARGRPRRRPARDWRRR